MRRQQLHEVGWHSRHTGEYIATRSRGNSPHPARFHPVQLRGGVRRSLRRRSEAERTCLPYHKAGSRNADTSAEELKSECVPRGQLQGTSAHSRSSERRVPELVQPAAFVHQSALSTA